MKWVIRSLERAKSSGYFAAIHGWTPMYYGVEKAKKFATKKEAKEYAIKELFTTATAFVVEAVEAR